MLKRVFVMVSGYEPNTKEAETKRNEYREKIESIIGEYEDISDIGVSFSMLDGCAVHEVAQSDLVVFCGEPETILSFKQIEFTCDCCKIPYIVI